MMLYLLVYIKSHVKDLNAEIQMTRLAQKRWHSIKLPCKTNLPHTETMGTKMIFILFYFNKMINIILVGGNT